MNPVNIGIVTVSDRASRGAYEDLSGPEIMAFLQERIVSDWKPVTRVIPDERPLIEQTLIQLCDDDHCALVITTGGTGPSPRDVTPEATEAVCDRMMPGFGEAMRAHSLRTVPTAILSRQTAGLRHSSLILNLPGKPAAIRECLAVVWPAIPYALSLSGNIHLKSKP